MEVFAVAMTWERRPYYSHRCQRPARRQTESELTNLTPMSAFSLRNRYLSRLGAQVRTAHCGDSLPSNSISSSLKLLSAFNSLQLPDHCSTHLSSLAYRSVLKWCPRSPSLSPSAPRLPIKKNAVLTKFSLFDDTFCSHLSLTCTEIIYIRHTSSLHIALHFRCCFHKCHTKKRFLCGFT